MSIVKIVNGRNNSHEFMVEKINYLCDDTKTDRGKLIETRGCSKNHVHRDMMSVKKAYHKPDGKQGEHIVLSITPDLPGNSDEKYLKIGREIADFFTDYQSLITVHKDTKLRHVHILLNSVSFKDGKKFSQGPKELNDFRLKCNRVLEKYDLDIIKKGTNEIRDTNNYDDCENFDFLEIFDDIPEKRTSLVIDASFDPMFQNKNKICKKTASGMVICYPRNDFKEEKMEETNMNNSNSTAFTFNPVQEIYNAQQTNNACSYYSPNTVQQCCQSQHSPFQKVTQPYSEPQTEIPSLTLNFSKKVNININNIEDMYEAMTYANSVEPISYDNKISATTIAMGAVAKLQKAGYNVNVNLDASTQFNINLVHSPDVPAYIEADYTEEK